jgi:sugar lactone lactonase YvrE
MQTLRTFMVGLFVLLLASACQPIAPVSEAPPPTIGQPVVLVQGAPLNGANGTMFGPDGYLYVASVGGSEIVVMDPETGEIVERYTQAQGVDGPDDLTFGPDGSLYWTSLFVGEVGRITPDGVKTGQMVAPGVNPITFSDDGRLFVALDFLGDALYELDPNLQEPPRLIAENLGFLNGMDFGPDGLLYGPLYLKGSVVRIDVDAEPAIIETVIDGLSAPAAVKFDSQGRLHALDQATGEVWRVDTETGGKQLVGQLPVGLDNLAFSTDDRLFVTNTDVGSVWEVLADGSGREVSLGGFVQPMGLAVVPAGENETVYVAGMFALHAFDGKSGAAAQAWIPMPAGTVAVHPDGVVMASWFGNVVEVCVPTTGEVLTTYQDIAVPLNAIEFQGDLVVAELGTGSVVRLSGDASAERTTMAGNLIVPLGLAADENNVWFGDMATGTIWQVVADGETLAEPRAVAQGLAAPSGLALDNNGHLLVVEVGKDRVISFDLATGEMLVVAEGLGLNEAMPTGSPPILIGVAVGPSGSIYVSGPVDNVVYRLDAVPY